MTLAALFGSPYRMNSHSPRTESQDDGPQGAELVTADGRALPLASATLRAEVGGGLARVVLEQTFANPHTETLHVTYKMPLPADGAVSGYAFTIGDRTIEGRVDPRDVARERFEEAILEGRTAALLEQQRADIFTQEIGNIPAGATIVARITVDQRLAWLPEGEWELRFPTVIGPRYVGATDSEADARAVRIEVAEKEDIRARIHLEVDVRDELAGGRSVSSPSHALVSSGTRERPGLHQLRAVEGARLDRDIVVRWPVARAEVGVSLRAARPRSDQPHGHLAYGLVTIVPPAPEANVASVPRDLIVLLDTSGSMSGGPLDQAKRVVAMLIDSLGAEDRLELIEFSSAPRPWQRDPRPATAETKKAALGWLAGLRAGGGTEMYSAVVEALRAIRPGAQRQVVLVTDGYIGGEQQLVDLLHERLPTGCRMHVVGVGAAVNRSLAIALARAGRGAEVLVGLDEDAERGARRLLDRTARPVLTEVRVEGDAVVEVAPQHVPDVFAGAPIVAGVKLAPHGGRMIVRGQLADGAIWERIVQVPATESGTGDPAIVALFAREHVADLEMRWSIGRETEMIDRTIERVGTVFQIATRLTSWVAVDDGPSVDPESGSRRIEQPQELPYGTTMAGFGLGPAGPGGAPGFAGLRLRSVEALASYGAVAAARPAMASPGRGGIPRKQAAPLLAAPSMPKTRRSPLLFIVLVLLLVLATVAWFLLFR